MKPLRAASNGLLTTRQLHDRGFSAKDIEALVGWCWLIRLHQGVYLVPAPDMLSRAALVAAGEVAGGAAAGSRFTAPRSPQRTSTRCGACRPRPPPGR